MIDENTGNFSASRHLYDWFQNTSHVIINIMIKNLRESDVRVRLIDDTLDVSCSLANGSLFKLHFNLFKPIYVAESSWSVTPSKLEVKLKKTDRKRWQSLEQIPEKSSTTKRTTAMAGIVEADSPQAKKYGTTAMAGIVEADSPQAKKYAAMSSNTDNQAKSDGKPKYDWYQTELYVVVTVMIRNLNADNVNVDYGEQSAVLTCKLENDSDYELNLKLSNAIIPKESSFKLTSSKVELKMKKKNSDRKIVIAKVEEDSSLRKSTASMNKNFYSKNWDKIVHDIEEEEKREGDQSIDDLIRNIYSQGDEETRKAINKSFQDSNGTVLSTNWKEVGKSKVDVKPPDGCEFRKWDQ